MNEVEQQTDCLAAIRIETLGTSFGDFQALKHWTRWLGVANRCVVPFTSFAEPNPAAKVEGGRTPNA